MRVRKLIITIGVICVSVALVQGTRAVQSEGNSDAPLIKVPRIKGDLDAKLKIIEFLDYECPSCGRATRTLEAYMKKYPHEILLEAKYFPLGGHKHSRTAALYAECAARQGKFWEYHHSLFDSQAEWKELSFVDVVFEDMGQNLGLDTRQLSACAGDKATSRIIEMDKEEGKSYGIRSTPTFFINGEIFVGHNALIRKLSSYFAAEDAE